MLFKILLIILVAGLLVSCILLKLYQSGKWHPKVSESEVEEPIDLSVVIQAFNDEFGTEDLRERGIREGNEPFPDISEEPA